MRSELYDSGVLLVGESSLEDSMLRLWTEQVNACRVDFLDLGAGANDSDHAIVIQLTQVGDEN